MKRTLLSYCAVAFLIGAFAPVALLFGSSQEPQGARELCPVRFEGVPAKTASPELREVRLLANNAREIKLLAPRSESLFLMRVDSIGGEAVYGQVTLDSSPKLKDFQLSLSMSGADWSTVAGDFKNDTARVEPGFFRIVLRYLALEAHGSRATVCEAISQPFELDTPFEVHRFE
jgi:hypothetical protein